MATVVDDPWAVFPDAPPADRGNPAAVAPVQDDPWSAFPDAPLVQTPAARVAPGFSSPQIQESPPPVKEYGPALPPWSTGAPESESQRNELAAGRALGNIVVNGPGISSPPNPAVTFQPPKGVRIPKADVLSKAFDAMRNLNNGGYVLDVLRTIPPERHKEFIEAAQLAAGELAKERPGAAVRLLEAPGAGLEKMANSLQEAIGLGGNDREIAVIDALRGAAATTTALALPTDPWYTRLPVQAAEMAPQIAGAAKYGVAGVATAFGLPRAQSLYRENKAGGAGTAEALASGTVGAATETALFSLNPFKFVKALPPGTVKLLGGEKAVVNRVLEAGANLGIGTAKGSALIGSAEAMGRLNAEVTKWAGGRGSPDLLAPVTQGLSAAIEAAPLMGLIHGVQVPGEILGKPHPPGVEKPPQMELFDKIAERMDAGGLGPSRPEAQALGIPLAQAKKAADRTAWMERRRAYQQQSQQPAEPAGEPNAKQVEEAIPPDGSGGPQPGIRQEGGSPGEGGKGVQPSRPGEVPEEKVAATEVAPEPPEHVVFRTRVTDAVAAIPTLKDAKVEVDPEGKRASIELPGGRRTTIHFDADEQIDGIVKEYPSAVEKPGGAFFQGHMYLRAGTDARTLGHETAHWLQSVGVVTPDEVAEHGGVEGFADAYGKWVEGKQRPAGVFQRVWDFLSRLLGTEGAKRKELFESLGERTQGPPEASTVAVPPGEAAPAEAPLPEPRQPTPPEGQPPSQDLPPPGGIGQEFREEIKAKTPPPLPPGEPPPLPPSEPPPLPERPETIAIKNAYTEARREQEGMPPRADPGERKWDVSMGYASSLSDAEVESTVTRLRATDFKKEPINEEDLAVLGRRETEIENRLWDARSAGDSDGVRAAQVDLAEVFALSEASGSESGRILNFRRAEWDKDYSLKGIVRKWVKGKRGPLTDAEWKRAEEIVDRLNRDLAAEADAAAEKRAHDAVETMIKEAKATEWKETRKERYNKQVEQQYETANRWGVDPKALRDEAERRAKTEAEAATEYNKALRDAAIELGLTRAQIENLRNARKDPATQPGVDFKALDIANNPDYAVLGLGGEGAEARQGKDYVHPLIDLIDGGPRKVPSWSERLEDSAKALSAEKLAAGGYGEAWEPPSEKAPPQKSRGTAAKKPARAERFDSWWENKVESAKERLKARMAAGQAFSIEAAAGKALESLPDLAIVGADYLRRGAKTVAEWSKRMVEDFGAAIEPHLKVILDASREHLKGAEKEFKKGTPEEVVEKRSASMSKRFLKTGVFSVQSVKGLARAVIDSGIDDLKAVSETVHTILQGIDPDITRRETHDLISGRGKVSSPRTDPTSRKLTDISRRLALIENIQGLKEEEVPLGMSFKRLEATEAERELRQEFNRERKAHPELVGTAENELKTPLQTAEKAARNRIADLEKEVGKRQELADARQRLDDIQKLPPEEQVAPLINELELQIQDLQESLKRPTPEPPSSAQLKADKARIGELIANRDALRKADPNFKAEQYEKWLARRKVQLAKQKADLLAAKAEMERTRKPYVKKERLVRELDAEGRKQWRENQDLRDEVNSVAEALGANRVEKIGSILGSIIKFNVLTSPPVVLKIFGAVNWKLPSILLDEVARSLLSKIPGFTEFAGPLEGRADIRAYIEGLLDYRTTASNIKDQILHHGTVTQSEYGARFPKQVWAVPLPGDSPRVVKAKNIAWNTLEMAGRLHGAEKELVRSPAEHLALAKMRSHFEADAKSRGFDSNDPDVRKGIEAAVEWANRQILMQKSPMATKTRGMFGARPDKGTGHKSLKGVAGEVFGQGILPVVRVGMNWAAELIERSVGGFSAPAELSWHGLIMRDLAKLSPEAKTAIARQMVYGISSLPVWALLGWFGYDHFGGFYIGRERLEGEKLEEGAIRIDGFTIPPLWTHSPLVGVAQAYATLRKLLNAYDKVGVRKHNFAEAVAITGSGILEETPLASQAKAITDFSDPAKVVDGIGKLMKTMIIPSWVNWIAKKLDTDVSGEPTKRKPHGIGEILKSGVPDLRESVPVKQERSKGMGMKLGK